MGGHRTLSTRLRQSLVITAALMAAACGTNPPPSADSSAPTDTVSTSTATTTQQTPRPAPSTTISATKTATFGPTKKTSTFTITDQEGYQAQVTVLWHQEQTTTIDQLLSTCRQLMTVDKEIAAGNAVVMASVVAEVRAQFPTTNGFTWPANKSLSFSYGDGKATQYWDRATSCYNSQDMDSPASMSSFTLKPGNSTVTIMWVRAGKKTPNNPTGKLDGDPASYNLAPSIGLGKCSGTGIEQGAVMGCSATYGT